MRCVQISNTRSVPHPSQGVKIANGDSTPPLLSLPPTCPGLGSLAFNSFRNNPYRAPNGAHLPSTRRAKDPQQNYAPTRCTTTLRQQHSSRHRIFHHHNHSLLHHVQHDAQKSNKVSCLLLPKSGRTHH